MTIILEAQDFLQCGHQRLRKVREVGRGVRQDKGALWIWDVRAALN